MPMGALKSLAHKNGFHVNRVERYWEIAKKNAAKELCGTKKETRQCAKEKGDQFYRYAMGVVKRIIENAKKSKDG